MTGLLFAALLGCNRAPCRLRAELVPGCGAVVDGHELYLGQTRAELEEAMGGAQTSRDMDRLGTRLDWEGVSAFLQDDAVTSLHLAAGDPVGQGTDALRASYGEAVVDPFTETWWYGAEGVAFELSDGVVRTAVVFAPQAP